ncbi:T3SS effector HopA1 family protein [Prauserella cavernicola]|uniref:Uncharacterized protein n=1 Tax=Prauserella cavernicola TaxID=2800127 RepID=A0A934QZ71_9PSEU|nr:T3SS effector HopA1 family protein [Prauserella cavernicola]MBK1787994.1 hypothetical protein [Prauserella cavernicola]
MAERDEIPWIRHVVTTVLPGPDGVPVDAAQREHLIERVYTSVHTRRPPDGGAFAANRVEFARLVHGARNRLADLTFPSSGLKHVREAGTDVVIRCPEGVELRVPASMVEPEYLGYVTLRISAVSSPPEARWIHWRRPGGHAMSWDARIYVNARADAAIEVWTEIVRALESDAVDFTTKVGGSTEMLSRADCIVVYVAAAELPRVLPMLKRIPSSQLDEPVAGFSHAVAHGIGAALVPGDLGPVLGSVGYHWARALVAAWTEGTLDTALAELTRSWYEAGRRSNGAALR